MTTLDDLLDLLPDNSDGEISAADLREIVTTLYDRSSYVGQVASDGTLIGGPPGWSSEYDDSTGLYTVHHDLKTEAYVVQVTALTKTVDGWAASVSSTEAGSFTYGVWSAAHDGVHGSYANFSVGLL